ncbi:MAG TPA: M23 family metallopeptidase, partial [Bacteroidales bacterium]|nr:M23 family metallopeptidase [Bacteroidales bacterium]
RVETVSGYGYSIQIKHDNDEYYSYYAHLVPDSGTVSVGDTVNAGDKIAVMGASGGNYAIHLHFELSRNDGLGRNGDTVDPKTYLGVTGNNSTNLPNPNS